MSTKRKTYSNEFKTKVVLEVLENNATINEIASKYNILPKSIQQWKKQFLENAPLVFEEAVPVKKYKEQVREKEKQIEDLQKALGKATIERDWILKKLKSLGSSDLKGLVDPKLKKRFQHKRSFCFAKTWVSAVSTNLLCYVRRCCNFTTYYYSI
jgi:putative transposase